MKTIKPYYINKEKNPVNILTKNLSQVLFNSIRFSEKWTNIIIIEIRSCNNKTNLIEEIFCSDNIMATIRENYVLSLG